MSSPREKVSDRAVLLTISGGLIVILLSIILGLFLTPRSLPNWAENVLVSIATASALKLGDCLATLVALANGRSTERLGTQLAAAGPTGPIQAEITNPADKPVPTTEAPQPVPGTYETMSTTDPRKE